MLIKRVFCFNSKDLILIKPVSEERLEHFLKSKMWIKTKNKGKKAIEDEFKKRKELIDAYFEAEHVGSLPHENSNALMFEQQIENFFENFLNKIEIDIGLSRHPITKSNLQNIYREFSKIVINSPEEQFIKFAPVWTRSNLFQFARNGYLYVFDKTSKEITKIKKRDIRDMNISLLENFLKKHVLEDPEIFYDNYDTLLSKGKRKALGSFFTKKGLSGFARYFICKNVGESLSSFYIIDPAAGSGTLLAGIKAKSVFGSDIDEFKNKLMDERNVCNLGEPIDFLRLAPSEYVSKINDNGGDIVNNPLLVISNPPYLGQQGRVNLEPSLNSTLRIGKIKSKDLYAYFLVQISRLFEAECNGLGEDIRGYTCIFTPNTWIQDRGEQQEFRDYVLSRFEVVSGFIINGSKFFDDMSQPVLFTILKRRKKIKFNTNCTFPINKILDLTQDHRLIQEIADLWEKLDPETKYEIEIEGGAYQSKLSILANKKIKKLEKELSVKKYDKDTLKWIEKRVYFSKILSATNCQSSANDRCISNKPLVSKSDVMNDIIEYREKCTLNYSDDELCKKLRLVYDNRKKHKKGYKFALEDKGEFKNLTFPDLSGPVLNYFEEIKKSGKESKIFNVAPIATDIALSEISKDFISINRGVVDAIGFKAIKPGSDEFSYLKDYQDKIGDVRGIQFIRSFLYHIPPFKEIVRDMSLNGGLVWLPEIRNGKKLREMAALAFSHTVATTKFQSISVSYNEFKWEARDFFDPNGWLKEAGLIKTLYIDLINVIPQKSKNLCVDAMESRKNFSEFNDKEIISQAAAIFEDAGFTSNMSKPSSILKAA